MRDKYALNIFKKIPSVIYLLAIVTIACTIFVPNFLSRNSIYNILFLSAITGVVTVGETMVMIAGGIDLSASGLVPFGGVLAARLMIDAGWPIPAAILAAVLAGFCVGLITGWFIGGAKNMPFIVTFAAQASTGGLALILANALPVSGLPKAFIDIAKGSLFGIPSLFIMMIVVVLLAGGMMKYTRFGSDVYSVGGNTQVAHLEGIKVLRVTILVYGTSAALATLAGVLYAARMYAAMPVAGSSYEFNAITAAVVGGVAFTGGKGSVLNAAIGVIVVTALKSALGMLSVSSAGQMLITGLIVIFALMLPEIQTVYDNWVQKARRRRLNSSDPL